MKPKPFVLVLSGRNLIRFRILRKFQSHVIGLSGPHFQLKPLRSYSFVCDNCMRHLIDSRWSADLIMDYGIIDRQFFSIWIGLRAFDRKCPNAFILHSCFENYSLSTFWDMKLPRYEGESETTRRFSSKVWGANG